jgi:hypothetical protein
MLGVRPPVISGGTNWLKHGKRSTSGMIERNGTWLKVLMAAGVVEHPVPLAREARETSGGVFARFEERVVDGVGLRDERAQVGELGRGRGVQRDGELARRIGGVVAVRVVQRLDRVPDRLRVEEVDEHALLHRRLHQPCIASGQ